MVYVDGHGELTEWRLDLQVLDINGVGIPNVIEEEGWLKLVLQFFAPEVVAAKADCTEEVKLLDDELHLLWIVVAYGGEYEFAIPVD